MGIADGRAADDQAAGDDGAARCRIASRFAALASGSRLLDWLDLPGHSDRGRACVAGVHQSDE